MLCTKEELDYLMLIYNITVVLLEVVKMFKIGVNIISCKKF